MEGTQDHGCWREWHLMIHQQVENWNWLTGSSETLNLDWRSLFHKVFHQCGHFLILITSDKIYILTIPAKKKIAEESATSGWRTTKRHSSPWKKRQGWESVLQEVVLSSPLLIAGIGLPDSAWFAASITDFYLSDLPTAGSSSQGYSSTQSSFRPLRTFVSF